MKVTRYIFSDHYKKSSDRLRNILGLYFDYKNGVFTTKSNPIKNIFIGSDIKFLNKELIDDETGLRKERVVLKFRNTEQNKTFLSSLYNDSSDVEAPEIIGTIKQVINNTISNDKIVYSDYNAKTFKVQELTNRTGDFYASTFPKYNFFIPKYEQKISSDVIPEEVLPNFYVMNLVLSKDILNSISQQDFSGGTDVGENSPYQDFFSKFDQFITLNNNILLNDTVNIFFGLVLVAYCEQYATVYDNVSVDFIATAKKRFSNLLNNLSDKDLISKLNQFKDSYPFYINIEWATTTDSPLLEFLKVAGISLSSLQEFINQKILLDIDSNQASGNNINFFDLQIDPDGGLIFEDQKSLFTYNAGDWINNFLNQIVNNNVDASNSQENITTINPNSSISGVNNNSTDIVQDYNSLSTLLNAIVAKPKLDDLIARNSRSYEDIINGELAETEILFYKIEKSIDEGATVLQTFYIPNIEGLDIQNYVDTQVKYNKEYVYRIFAYTIVYGTNYHYSKQLPPVASEPNTVIIDPGLSGIDNNVVIDNGFGNSPVANNNSSFNNFIIDNNNIPTVPNNNPNIESPPTQIEGTSSELIDLSYLEPIIFDVFYYPSIKLIELDYTDRLRGVIIDFPPTPPIAEFYPIKDSSNKFKLSLSPSSGEIIDFPKYIYASDKQLFDRLISSQKTSDGKVKFRYEGEIKKYELFRIENEPINYQSFSEDESSIIKVYENVENVMINEFIESNKDYYYTFRSYDFHNHFSNPSPIFKVKLFVNDGVEFLDVQTFNFKEKKKIVTKSFKKFIKIDTSMEQKQYSFIDDRLGLNDESVYNQEFILRVKSKHTGKTIDLHFTFNKQNTI